LHDGGLERRSAGLLQFLFECGPGEWTLLMATPDNSAITEAEAAAFDEKFLAWANGVPARERRA
jgi:hypothetical protein